MTNKERRQGRTIDSALQLLRMDVMRITVVGQDLFKIMPIIFERVGLNPVNQVNTGMLGNLKILTYEFELREEEVIAKRRKLMDEMAKDSVRLMPMYVHGDWMRIFVFKPIRTCM